MQIVSDAFKARVKGSHTMVAKVEISRDGVLLWSGKMSDGNVNYDADSINLRRATLRINQTECAITGNDLVPMVATDMLAPFGTEFKLWRGVKHLNRSEELCPQGVFVIDKTRIMDSGDGFLIDIYGHDRSKRVSRARFEKTFVVVSATNCGTQAKKILVDRAPWIEYGMDFNTFTSISSAKLVFDAGDDPWEACYKMLHDIGYRLFFDENGLLMAEKEPADATEDDAAIWEFIEGPECSMLYSDKAFDSEKVYNRVKVNGEPTDGSSPVTVTVSDENPNSPTYINGPYGIVPYFYKSPFIKTTSAALETATKLLQRHLSGAEELHILGIPMPALDVDDNVRVVRSASRIDSVYRINKITMPMTSLRGMDVMMTAKAIA